MKYEIHNLELYEPLLCGIKDDNGNGRLVMCTSRITKKNMDPKPEDFIATDKTESDTIPSGTYFFVQGFIAAPHEPISSSGKLAQEITDAAQSLWLEFVWQEKEPEGTAVYLRILHEDIKKSAGAVFQLFRPISKRRTKK